jgi:O-antigen/teichoic acid export membrane protein
VVVVASGTAGAQAISMAFSPIITRLYGPEAFGLMGMFMAIASIATPLAAFSYPIAIVLPEQDRDAKGIACLSFYLALGVTCLVTLFLLIAGDWMIKILKVQEISSFIFLIPVAMLFAAFSQIMRQWLIRKKAFGITARVAVLQAVIMNISKTGFGLLNPAAAGLIIITVLGSAIQGCMLAIGAKRIEKDTPDKGIHYSCRRLWSLAKSHYDFPLYRTPQIFINSFSQSLPVLMLAAFFGPASAGFYALCEKLLDIPSQLIGKSVGDVFYPRITEAARNNEKITVLIFKATLTLAAVGFLPFALVAAFGPWIFGFAFGGEWIQAGEYARWLSLWMFFSFINRPSVVSIPVLHLQGLFLIYEVFSVFLRILALGISFYGFHNDILAIALFSLAGALLNFSLIIVTCYSDRLTIQK